MLAKDCLIAKITILPQEKALAKKGRRNPKGNMFVTAVETS